MAYTSKKRKYDEISGNDAKEEEATLNQYISKFENILEKTTHLNDLFTESSQKYKSIHEKFKQIENDWKHYYLFYFLDQEKEESRSLEQTN